MRSSSIIPLALKRKLQPLNQLYQTFSRRRQKQLIGLTLLSLLAAIAEVGNIGALLPFLKLLAAPQQALTGLGPVGHTLSTLNPRTLLLLLGAAFFVIVTLSSGLRILTIQAQLKLTALIGTDLGEQVLSSVLHRPYPWHLQHNSSETLGLLTKDVDQVTNAMYGLLGLFINGLLVVLLGTMLIALNPTIMLAVSALLGGFYLIVYRLTRATLGDDGNALTKNYQASVQVAQEGLGGIRDVLLDRSQQLYVQSFGQFNRYQRLAFSRINFNAQAPRYAIEGAAMLLIVGLAMLLALQGQGIEQQLPLLGTLSLGAYRLLQPLQQCFGSVSNLKAYDASLQRLLPYLASVPSTPPSQRSVDLHKPTICLSHVWFRYQDHQDWVLRDLTLTIPAGSTIALVGTTGSGKSTTTDIILGLLDPVLGELTIQGRSIITEPGLRLVWQEKISHVPQQIYLSDSSFAENIAFGVPYHKIDLLRVRKAAQQACIAELIESQPRGYAELVGERGVRLSGGQRQRIGIARALYKQAQVIVFDEATSALDNRTEQQVMKALASLGQEITVILVAHRLTTVQGCDCIYLLEKGEVRAKGSYIELLEQSAEFRTLASLQGVNR